MRNKESFYHESVFVHHPVVKWTFKKCNTSTAVDSQRSGKLVRIPRKKFGKKCNILIELFYLSCIEAQSVTWLIVTELAPRQIQSLSRHDHLLSVVWLSLPSATRTERDGDFWRKSLWADSVSKLRCPSVVCLCVCVINVYMVNKNPAYGRHQISGPMRIKAPIFFLETNFTNSIRKALWVGPQMRQSITSHAWTIHGCNLEQLLVFKAIRVGWRVHQSTSQTPPTHGRSMYEIQNNSSFLESTSWLTSAPVHPLNTSHAWTIHLCNLEQLLIFRALPSWSTRLFRVPTRWQSMYAIRNNSLF